MILTEAKLIGSALLLAALIAGYAWFVHSERAIGAQQCRAEVAAGVAKSQAEAATTEAQWKEKLDAIATDKQAQITALAASRAALLGQLRNRPERRPDVPQTAASCGGATGAELARPDAEFLGGYAAFARSLQLELGACHAREAVKTLPQ